MNVILCNTLKDDIINDNYFINNQVIIFDSDQIDFSLEVLQNTSLLDNYRILKCKNSINLNKSVSFYVNNRDLLGLSKSFLQTISSSNELLLDYINKNKIIPIEYVIAKFLIQFYGLSDDEMWFYCAEHASGYVKIIAGIGTGILISRAIQDEYSIKNIEKEIYKTVNYLKRFGLEENINCFTNCGYLEKTEGIKAYKLLSVEFLCKKLCIDQTDNLLEIIESYTKYYPITHYITNKYFILKLLKKYINVFLSLLYIASLILLLDTIIVYSKNMELNKNINDICMYNKKLSTKHASVAIDLLTYKSINDIINLLNTSDNPLKILKQMKKILNKKMFIEMYELNENRKLTIICKMLESDYIKLKKNLNNNIKYYKIDAQNLSSNKEANNQIITFKNNIDKMVNISICIQTK